MAKRLRGVPGALHLTRDLPVEVVTMCDGKVEYNVTGGDILEIDRVTVGLYKDRIQIHVRPARR